MWAFLPQEPTRWPTCSDGATGFAVHLHGLAGLDHTSLAHVPMKRLDPVVNYLRQHSRGLIEVFNRDDFESSLALQASLGRTEVGRFGKSPH
jgi:hypothetical protein